MNLDIFRRELKFKVANNIQNAFDEISESLKQDSSHFNDYILILGNHSFINQQSNIGVTSPDFLIQELSKIRKGLIMLIDKFQLEDLYYSKETVESEQEPNMMDNISIDELGFIDYLLDIHETSEKLNKCLVEMSGKISLLGNDISLTATQITLLKQVPQQTGVIQVKRIMEKSANEVYLFNSDMEPLSEDFKNYSSRLLQDLKGTLDSYYDYNNHQNFIEILDNKKALRTLKDAYSQGKEGISSMFNAINTLPNLEVKFNKARKVTVNILQDVLSTIDVFIKEAATLEKRMDNLLEIEFSDNDLN